MEEILLEQSIAGCRIRHAAIPTAFSVLRTNAKHPVGRINIVGSEPAQFLSPQCTIVRKRQHRAVADGLSTRGGQNRLPVFLVGNPWQPPIAADEGSPSIMQYRVLATKPLIDKVAVEEPQYSYALLNGCIRDRAVELHGCEIRTNVGASRASNTQLLSGEKAKENLKSSGIGFERVATEATLRLKGQPRAAQWVGSRQRDKFPTNRVNNEGDGQFTSRSKDSESAR